MLFGWTQAIAGKLAALTRIFPPGPGPKVISKKGTTHSTAVCTENSRVLNCSSVGFTTLPCSVLRADSVPLVSHFQPQFRATASCRKATTFRCHYIIYGATSSNLFDSRELTDKTTDDASNFHRCWGTIRPEEFGKNFKHSKVSDVLFASTFSIRQISKASNWRWKEITSSVVKLNPERRTENNGNSTET